MIRRVLSIVGVATLAAILSPAVPAAAGGCGEVTEGTAVSVALQGLCFDPSIVRVEPGQTITFVNEDATDHSVIGAGFSFATDGILKPGREFSHTFGASGVYPFSCYLHPGMTGVIVVGDASAPGPASGSEVAPLAPSPAAPLSGGAQAARPPASATLAGWTGWWLAGVLGLLLGAGGVLAGRRALGTLRARG
jgi:plastocyanin